MIHFRLRRARGGSFASLLLAGCGCAALVASSAAAAPLDADAISAPADAPGSVGGTVTQASGEYLDGVLSV